MRAVYLMQNECDKLDVCVQERFSNYDLGKFCGLQYFSNFNLSVAIKCTKFDGYTGLISFNNQSLERTFAPLELMQVQPDGVKSIGLLTNFSLEVNTSAAFFYSPVTSGNTRNERGNFSFRFSNCTR